MKKLIDELEAAQNEIATDFDSSDYDCGMTDGFHAALDIVRAHNPWHDVGELPPMDEEEPDFSIDVMVTNGNGYRLGYYAFCTESWVLHKYFREPKNVSHWAHLPELPK